MAGRGAGKPRLAQLADRIARPFLVAVLLATAASAAWWWPGPGARHHGGGGGSDRHLSLRAVAGHAGGHAGRRRCAGAPRRAGAPPAGAGDLHQVDTVVFDKTGTLTLDRMAVSAMHTRGGRRVVRRCGWRPRWRGIRCTRRRAPSWPGPMRAGLAGTPDASGVAGNATAVACGGLARGRAAACAWARPRCAMRRCSRDLTACLQVHLADAQGWLATFDLARHPPDAQDAMQAPARHGPASCSCCRATRMLSCGAPGLARGHQPCPRRPHTRGQARACARSRQRKAIAWPWWVTASTTGRCWPVPTWPSRWGFGLRPSRSRARTWSSPAGSWPRWRRCCCTRGARAVVVRQNLAVGGRLQRRVRAAGRAGPDAALAGRPGHGGQFAAGGAQFALDNDKVVRQFAIMTVVWGVVGMLVGVIIAAQLAWPELNFGIPWLTYGRLRPLHTNAVIFAFGGCALFATSYYVVQRTCQTRCSDKLAAFTFWGWQAGDRGGGDHAAAGLHQRQGIRRARVADRHPDHAGVGGLRGRVLRHHRQAQGQAHLRGQLVLRRLHPAVAVLHLVNSAAIPAG
jgi:hypothetical protein